jgi:hypothetical protein
VKSPVSVLDCGVLAIVTPRAKQYQLSAIETDADIVLGWDGATLLVLKFRGSFSREQLASIDFERGVIPNHLACATQALEAIANAAPSAAMGSIASYLKQFNLQQGG